MAFGEHKGRFKFPFGAVTIAVGGVISLMMVRNLSVLTPGMFIGCSTGADLCVTNCSLSVQQQSKKQGAGMLTMRFRCSAINLMSIFVPADNPRPCVLMKGMRVISKKMMNQKGYSSLM